MGRHLGIDLFWILVDFGSRVGAKLLSKIYKNDAKSIHKGIENKGIENQIPKRRRLGGVLELVWRRFGRHLEAFEPVAVEVRRMRVGLPKSTSG